MNQPEPKQKVVSRLRWVSRGIGLLVVLGLVVFIVSAAQNGRAIQQLKSNPGITIDSESPWLMNQLPAAWQNWIQANAGQGIQTALERPFEIDCTNQALSDADLSAIARMTNLKMIHLNQATFSEEGFAQLAGLRNLRALILDESSISDAGLAHLKGFEDLKVLRLRNTKISDQGLQHLENLRRLEFLDLNGTSVSDAGLVYLQGLVNLKYLNLEGTQVTDEGLAHLRESLPNLSD